MQWSGGGLGGGLAGRVPRGGRAHRTRYAPSSVANDAWLPQAGLASTLLAAGLVTSAPPPFPRACSFARTRQRALDQCRSASPLDRPSHRPRPVLPHRPATGSRMMRILPCSCILVRTP